MLTIKIPTRLATIVAVAAPITGMTERISGFPISKFRTKASRFLLPHPDELSGSGMGQMTSPSELQAKPRWPEDNAAMVLSLSMRRAGKLNTVIWPRAAFALNWETKPSPANRLVWLDYPEILSFPIFI